MSWKTIYVSGREGFLDDVVKNLERSGIEFMSGYNSRESSDSYELFWVPETMALRKFKLAIGARTIFRYRLRFDRSLEGFIHTVSSDELTAEDKRRIERMRATERAA
jgi:hypothetical protein